MITNDYNNTYNSKEDVEGLTNIIQYATKNYKHASNGIKKMIE